MGRAEFEDSGCGSGEGTVKARREDEVGDVPGGGDAVGVGGGEDGRARVGQQAGFRAFEVNVNALRVGFSDGFLAGPAAEEGCVPLGGSEAGDLRFFQRGEDAAPEGGVDGVRRLDVEADFNVASYGEGAPVFGVAEVEGRRVGRVERGLAVGASAEEDFTGFAGEVGGEDLAHAGVGADPAGAVELGTESLSAAAFAVVEGVEFAG